MKFSRLVKILLPLSLANIVSLAIPYSDAIANTTTSTVCYFKKNGNSTWQWGLNYDYSWYKLYGEWNKNHETKNHRFITSTNKDSIIQSCKYSQRYYQKLDHELIGIYASDSKHDKNYPIYIGEKRFSPESF